MQEINLGGEDWLLKEFVGMDWVWRNSISQDTTDTRWWLKATVPGSVLNDLWQAGKVPDPHFELNSKMLEWVSERTWIYRKSFRTPENVIGKRITLCFEGIDYQSEIYLNGKLIGKQEGMFLPGEFEVSDMLLPEGDNLIAVVIEQAPKEQPQVGKTSLVRTNKTRMNYWWDFCPRMIHQGIWDKVYLKITGQERLRDIFFNAKLSKDLSSAVLTADIEAEGADGCRISLEINTNTVSGIVTGHKLRLETTMKHPRLWQPNGYGEPYQYDIAITLFDQSGAVSDHKILKYGIRKIEFVKNERCHPDATPFVLKVNGRKIYMNGYNWVPMDAMYGVNRPEKLHRLIKLAKLANTVIFRVWGGGLIEKDAFYEACAENGILVWQEFIQSSSGIDNKPPEDPDFIRGFIEQAEIIIKRKRNHTALAIWCGGNELSDWDGNPVDDTDTLIGKLYDTVKRLDPQRKWLPSSPSGGVFNNSVKNIQEQPDMLWDVHGPWEHQGLQKHCKLYNMGTALLHSEFGVEGMTNRDTLEKSVSKEHMLPANKENEIYFHRGSWWTNEPLVQETFGGLETIDGIRTASQYMQFEGLKYAVECNRRRAFQNSGTFPWQFNEPYPNNYCTSNLDYYANPKPVYYGVSNSYRDILVSASFASPSIHDQSIFECRIFTTTSLLEEERKRFGVITIHSEVVGTDGTIYYSEEKACLLAQNQTNEVSEIILEKDAISTMLFLLRLELVDEEGVLIAENEYLFTKEKDLSNLFQLPQPQLQYLQEDSALMIHNVGKTAALYLFITNAEALPHLDFLYFNKNYFCLLPQEQRKVIISSDRGMLSGKSLMIENFLYREKITLI